MAFTEPDFSAKRGDLICRPVHWIDIARFLVFNFVLHAVTVMSSPGEGPARWITNRLIALFIPLVGTIGAVGTIYRYARGEQTPLGIALRAQALCMIEPAATGTPTGTEASEQDPVRTAFPKTHMMWANRLIAGRLFGSAPERQSLTAISLTVTTIQGQHPFEKPGYRAWAKDCFRTPPRVTAARLVTVPWNYVVTPLLADGQANFDLAYNYSAVKIIAAITQILYGTFQLYQSSGPQITKAGYAAYQLALIPYIIMSLINLLASLCEPEFPAIFLVRQEAPLGNILEEISGEVGKVSPPAAEGTLHTSRKDTNPSTEFLLLGLCVLLILVSFIVPYLIIWWLTGFKVGRDSGTIAWEWSTQLTLSPKVKWFPLFNSWVVLWIGYGQVATLAMIGWGRGSPAGLRMFRWAYGLLASVLSLFGFSSVIRLMANDSICVVV